MAEQIVPMVGPGEVVTVVNQKGGQGKTTTAVSLAAELASRGLRVRLVDADAQEGSTTRWLPPQWQDADPEQRFNLLHVLQGRVGLAQATWPTTIEGLELVPAFASLKSFESETVPGRDVALQTAIDRGPQVDVTIVDCAPDLGQTTLTALVAGSAVVIPVKVGGLDLWGVAELNKTLALVRDRLRADQRTVAVVVTQVLRSGLTDDVIDQLKADYPDALHATVRHTVRVGEAPLEHTPLHVYDPEATATVDYAALASNLFAPILEGK
ncbi:ParA family protein [Nocardiopsis sp. EMB25]|uniref:ParA family protein n=1 Tax=Nocardiopsis sp. EMB25 TaxID=2835867 RepID=UPI00228515F6|nr:ParA family protein [Nocardiopsis sp. EMB25]MCY9787924.1 ParA family protein [Nocardiopsis sp. EMB25]